MPHDALARATDAIREWLRGYCDRVCQYGPMGNHLQCGKDYWHKYHCPMPNLIATSDIGARAALQAYQTARNELGKRPEVCPRCGRNLVLTRTPELVHYARLDCPEHGFIRWAKRPVAEPGVRA